MNYPVAEASCKELSPRQLTVSERLANEKERLEKRLEEVNAAIDALDQSPQVAEAVDALSKLGHF